ncbi:hypothetical protein Javan351_0014 [Streptococcus phage Javan351]|nr:hypothetical protein Javan351_0014 [Streptococcus phage Javan351]
MITRTFFADLCFAISKAQMVLPRPPYASRKIPGQLRSLRLTASACHLRNSIANVHNHLLDVIPLGIEEPEPCCCPHIIVMALVKVPQPKSFQQVIWYICLITCVTLQNQVRIAKFNGCNSFYNRVVPGIIIVPNFEFFNDHYVEFKTTTNLFEPGFEVLGTIRDHPIINQLCIIQEYNPCCTGFNFVA